MTGSAPGEMPTPTIESHTSRRPLWRRFGLLVLVVIALMLFLAPLGIARYLESNGITLSNADGTTFEIQIGNADLGWLSPVRLNNVQVNDGAGHQLLSAPRIVSQRSLASLAAHRHQPGRFYFERPRVNVVVRSEGSNLQDFLQALKRDGNGKKALDVAATITQGLMSFADVAGNPLVEIDAIDFSGKQLRGSDQQIEFELSAHVVSDGERRPIQAAVRWRGPREGLPFLSGAGTVGIKLDSLPVAALEPRLSRVVSGLTIRAGSLSGQLLMESDFRESHILKAAGDLVSRDVNGETITSDGTVKPFSWTDEPLTFLVDGQYDPQAAVLQVAELSLQSSPLTLNSSGTVSDLTGKCLVDVGGDVSYDLEQLVQSLAEGHSEHLQVEGLRTRWFHVRGPLAVVSDGQPRWDLSHIDVEAEIGWDRANVFGVRSEQASLVTRLQEGALLIEPREVPVSGGQFEMVSRVELLNGDPTAELRAGPALTDVQLSEEMCQLWLKFLSPVLADATRANGRLSIALNDGRLPIHDAAGGHVSGMLEVHSAQVRPGPFAEQIIGVVETIRGLIERKPGGLATDRLVVSMEQQQVPFLMSEGRVRHESLQFLVAGVVVRTSGSVGLDETLDLMVEVPLPESWFQSEVLASALGGQVIRIPVRGTFDRPRFELAALRELTRRLAVSATGNLLKQLLD